jgi:hypothetical protein
MFISLFSFLIGKYFLIYWEKAGQAGGRQTRENLREDFYVLVFVLFPAFSLIV